MTSVLLGRFKIEGGRDHSSAFSDLAMDDAVYVYNPRVDGVRKIGSGTGETVRKRVYSKALNITWNTQLGGTRRTANRWSLMAARSALARARQCPAG
jgi:hypothetical protein